MKPFLKWCGSKRQPYIIDRVKPLIDGKFWVEPFLGSGALPLALGIKSGIFSDANHHLIALWEWVQSGEGVTFDFPSMNTPSGYADAREQFNMLTDTRIKSQLFYYLNQTGFNGLCRFNSKGVFNVPFGRDKVGNPKKISYLTDFSGYTKEIKKWEFYTQDFRQTIGLAPYGSIIYCDPPYHGTFTNYTGTPYTLEDQLELIALLVGKRGCRIVVSNSPLLEEAYRDAGFKTELLEVSRTVSSMASTRGKTLELFAFLDT
jgi:DNA adenine methylase